MRSYEARSIRKTRRGEPRKNMRLLTVTLLIIVFFKSSVQEGRIDFIEVIDGPIHSVGSTVELTSEINVSSLITKNFLVISWVLLTRNETQCEIRRMIYPNMSLAFNFTHNTAGRNVSTCRQGTNSVVKYENDFLSWNMTWKNASVFNDTTYIRDTTELVRFAEIRLQVKGCTVPNKYMYCDPENTSMYMEVAHCSCENGSMLFQYNQITNTADFIARCSATAKWESHDGYACYKAPNITLEYNRARCCDYREGENDNFTCRIQEGGYPNNYTHFVYINENKQENTNINMTPELNRATVDCRANYNFFNDTGLKSEAITLNIIFKLKDVNDSSCSSPINETHENVSISFKFSINPKLNQQNVLTKARLLGTDDTDQTYRFGNITKSDENQDRYTYKLELDNVRKGTIYIFCANYLLGNDTMIHTYNLSIPMCGSIDTSMQTTTEEYQLLVISLSASGGGLAISGTIVVCVLIKRRKRTAKGQKGKHEYVEASFNDGAQKEDVINPLYGTSTNIGKTQQGGDASDSEKEEKSNPVYQPISNAVVEESYSQVDIKNKKKNKKKDRNPKSETNKAFASDNQAAIYAVVEKKAEKSKPSTSGQGSSKNTVQSGEIYSEVKKDKKKEKKDKPSTSGQSRKDALESEATYAEVKKDKPPKKGKDDDEDLHGSSK